MRLTSQFLVTSRKKDNPAFCAGAIQNQPIGALVPIRPIPSITGRSANLQS